MAGYSAREPPRTRRHARVTEVTAMPSNVRVEQHGAVTSIIINRPERRNAVDASTAVALREAFMAFEADEIAHVAVLSGASENFCAGYDLKALSTDGMDYEPEGVGPMGPSRMMIGKPVIAAVEGYAVAGGLELALMCDMRVASQTAIFGVFCRRWGVPLIDGGTVRLPRIVGQGRALDMILTGRPVDALEALAMGLANRVVPAGHALAAALEIAHGIATFPQTCMLSDRSSVHQQWDETLRGALELEGRLGAPALTREGIAGAGRFAAGKGRGGSFANL